MGIFKKIFGGKGGETPESPEYIEVDTGKEEKRVNIVVRPFILKSFDDVTRILEVLREGYTIALVDIKPLKQKDVVELKRAISKLKKTVDALEGNIAGFGENTIVATPSFVDIYRGEKVGKVEKI
ncbi:MAG: cell division protein SepF [Candidatus Pacearchaeota archaeon]|nr:MAG: cell division protein SepF [Candidatus Pacearchaeota archaeon]